MDKIQLLEILTAKRFTTAIPISTLHNSLKIIKISLSWCHPGYGTCLSVLHIRFWNKVLFLLQEDPKVK